MQDFIRFLENIQNSIYWKGVLISLLEIVFFVIIFMFILFRVILKTVENKDKKTVILKFSLLISGIIIFLLMFSSILSFNLNHSSKELKNNFTSFEDYRFVEKLDGDFIKASFINGKINEEDLDKGFTVKKNIYNEYYEVPINKNSFDTVKFQKEDDISVSMAYVEDVDTSESIFYITVLNLGNNVANNIKVKLIYVSDSFEKTEDIYILDSLEGLSSKVVEIKFDSSRINKISGAVLNAVIEYENDSNKDNNVLKVSYFK